MTTTPAPEFVDVKQAAALLAVGTQKVYELLDARELQGARQGVKRLVAYQSLKDYAQRLIDAENVGADT